MNKIAFRRRASENTRKVALDAIRHLADNLEPGRTLTVTAHPPGEDRIFTVTISPRGAEFEACAMCHGRKRTDGRACPRCIDTGVEPTGETWDDPGGRG